VNNATIKFNDTPSCYNKIQLGRFFSRRY